MQNKSIIFFDIDGTLLDQNKDLPASAKEAIFKLKEAGHLIAIATGRAPFLFPALREELGVTTYVSFNGQYVVHQNKPIYTKNLDPSSLTELKETAFQHEHPLVYMDQRDMKANVPDHPSVKESIGSLQVSEYPALDPDYYHNREIYQALLFCTKEEEQRYRDKHPAFDFIRWHPLALDVLPSNGSKANGIDKLIQALGIDENNVYAFGDGLNDLEMLQFVKNSVAMGNAEPEVKEVATYVTSSVEEDGIVRGLQKLGLL